MKISIKIIVLMAITVHVASACQESFPEWNRGTTFSIIVLMNGRPFSGMKVFLEPKEDKKKANHVEGLSDENGLVNFTKVKPGSYYVEAARLGIEVGPGTVIVAKQGSSERIEIEWPLRTSYSVSSLAGHFQKHLFLKSNIAEGYVHPQNAPLFDAELTLSRIDSMKKIATITTSANGDFDFHSVDPGLYILHIKQNESKEYAYLLDDDLLIDVNPLSSRGALNLQLDWSSCGMQSAEIH
jgi:hypothetical protein